MCAGLAVNGKGLYIKCIMISAKEVSQKGDPNKRLLREKTARRNALVNAIEDLNIQILAITGEIRWIDEDIDELVECVKLEAIREASLKRRKFDEKNPSYKKFVGYTASDIGEGMDTDVYNDGLETYIDVAARLKKNS